jgi:ketosteroid isomerase-like protein
MSQANVETVRQAYETFSRAGLDAGEDHVVVLLRLHMRGTGSGVTVTAHTTNVWTLRDGKALRMAVYNDKAEALKALSRSG